MFRCSGTVLMLILCVSSQCSAQQGFDFFQPVTPPRNVQVMVHRGMAKAAPENSTAAIEMCIQDYCEFVEVDVRLTMDGRHIIIHNDTVDATTNGHGRVDEFTLAELQKLDAGSWFAERFAGERLLSLPELLKLAKGKINLCLDCKHIDAKLLVEEVTAAGMVKQVFVYGSRNILAEIKAGSHGSIAVMTKYQPKLDSVEALNREVGPAAVEINADDVTTELCQQFHAAGIKMAANALGEKNDNPEVWAKVIDAGIDWIQTDAPSSLLFFNAHRRIRPFPVKIAAHRGVQRYAPENTIPAIQEAARLGVDYAEIDIRTTRDGKHVLIHDGTVDRTTIEKGNVRDKSFDEITRLSAGIRFGNPFVEMHVPSFDEGLAVLGDQMGVYLDAKDIAPDALSAAIHRHHLEERHVVYQSVEYCDTLRKLDPSVRTLPPLKRLDQLDAVAAIKPYGVDASWSILSDEMIATCHQQGIQVFSDLLGPNETIEQYQKVIGWKIDCIQTDHPLRVLRAIELLADQTPQ
jgi:glycerophosphoryl diester phosphodiesterase